MRKFQRLFFVLKRSYISYYLICMTVPLRFKLCIINDIFLANYSTLRSVRFQPNII